MKNIGKVLKVTKLKIIAACAGLYLEAAATMQSKSRKYFTP
jgi:hypothetical protein